MSACSFLQAAILAESLSTQSAELDSYHESTTWAVCSSKHVHLCTRARMIEKWSRRLNLEMIEAAEWRDELQPVHMVLQDHQ